MPTLDLREPARRSMPRVRVRADLRLPAIGTWRGRMINEHGSARVFEALALQLAAAGASAEDVARCEGFAAEERRHGVLCGAVVEALGGEARAEVSEPEAYPLHPDVGPLEGALRNLLSISCLSETVAVALIGAERLEMPEGELKELLTRIYAEECGHSNFGWRLMRSLLPDDPALKQRLGAYLRVAFAHLERHELAHLPAEAAWPEEGKAVGLCDGASARALFYATLSEVIVPNLEALGIPATQAWETRAA
ncbi:MAG: ferritin-like domain-containing protein [Alphaproteobacteria bacterium]|nr:ferritin-like domain-containing protein [Alphaproteobacteria bacterium]MCB9792345.1 ferritin-like domain-containing protein [Alphaproteobacteria bacterium]